MVYMAIFRYCASLGAMVTQLLRPWFPVSGGLANRVKRKDTLAMRLERQEREEREAQENQANLSWSNREQWEEMRNRIGTTLTR